MSFMVGTTGFEPATPASRMQCSTRLSHVPTPLNYSVSAGLSSAWSDGDLTFFFFRDICFPFVTLFAGCGLLVSTTNQYLCLTVVECHLVNGIHEFLVGDPTVSFVNRLHP